MTNIFFKKYLQVVRDAHKYVISLSVPVLGDSRDNKATHIVRVAKKFMLSQGFKILKQVQLPKIDFNKYHV